jgi:hypothetical protein
MISARCAIFLSFQTFEQTVSDSQGVGDDSQGRVHSSEGGEERSVHDVEIINVVRAAVQVQHRSLRIRAEPAGAVLMSDSFQRNGFLQIEFFRHITMSAIHFL